MSLTPQQIQEMHNNLAAFNSLYILVRLMKLSELNGGTLMHIKMVDRLAQEVFLNSKVLLAPLMEEFNRVGQALDTAGVDLNGQVEQLEARIQQVTGGGAGQPPMTTQ